MFPHSPSGTSPGRGRLGGGVEAPDYLGQPTPTLDPAPQGEGVD